MQIMHSASSRDGNSPLVSFSLSQSQGRLKTWRDTSRRVYSSLLLLRIVVIIWYVMNGQQIIRKETITMQNAPSLRLSKMIHAQLILIMLNSYLHSSKIVISIKYTIERIMNIAIERCRYILVIFSPTYNKGIELLMHGVLMKLLKTKPGIITKIKKLTTNFREVMVQQLVEFLI